MSAAEHSVKSRFRSLQTWSSVKDSREEESSIDLRVGYEHEPASFCHLEISCAKYEDRRNKCIIEVRGYLELSEGYDVFLDNFPIDQTVLDLKAFCPIVTAGSRYLFKRGESKMTVERTLDAEIPILEAEPTLKELESFDFVDAGDLISDCVGVLSAVYLAAKRAPITA